MTTNEAAREALAVFLKYTDEWSTDRDMGATVHYCRSCGKHAERMPSGRFVGWHVRGCELRAALDLAEAIAKRPVCGGPF